MDRLMRERRDDSTWSGSWRRLACAVVMLSMVGGCLLGDEESQPRQNLEEDIDVRVQKLSSFCTIQIEGHGAVDVEEDYLPNVVACENGNAPMEALKAQAVAARTYAMFQREAGAEPLADSEDDQVYSCDYAQVEQRHIDAVRATAGEVLVNGDRVIASFYVAGAEPSSPSCVAGPGDSDSTNTEQFVTYNEGRTGGSVQPSSLGHPANPANRGCKSQNGASCLADEGWDYERILRFYYGDDVRVRIPDESACVEQSVDGGVSSPAAGGGGGDDVCGLSPTSDDGHQGCIDPSQTPTILPRSAWNARPPTNNRPHHTPNRITVHHTVTANEASDGASQVRLVQNIHQGQNWSDIGYHYLISWDGTIYAGNPADRMGAHARNDNSGNLGIALLGTFHESVSPSSAQVESLARMLAYLSAKHDIPLDRSQIQGHGEWPGQSTLCPGHNVQDQLDNIVDMARSDGLCGEPEQPSDSGGGADVDEYRYVRVTGLDENPIPDPGDNPVDGFEVDAIFGQRGSESFYANNVLCSPGVNNAPNALGEPENTSCENRTSTVAGVPVGGELVVELSQPLGEGDVLNVVQNSYQTAMASCEPTGTAQVAVSKDGRIWKVLDDNVTENWTRTLSADDFVFGEGDEAGDLDGFQFIAPKAGGVYTPDLTFKAIASNPQIHTVEYYVPADAEEVIDEDWLIGSSTASSSNYEVFYEFQYYGQRRIAARGLDSQGNVVATQEITITVSDHDGVIPEGERSDTPSGSADINTALADAIAQEGGRCYDPNDSQASGDRCQNGTGGWSSGLCWRFVKRALERAGINWAHLQNAGPCSFNRFHLSAFGFRCNADANPGMLAQMGLKKIDVPTTQAPAGAIIAWDRGCAGYHSEHGHIEISQGDGTACSDYCGNIRTDASCASVYVPVN